ncbi:MAG: fused MFS/spermidine synthase, partial [Acidobacteriota bacterium]
ALGSFLAGRLIDKVKDPLKTYGVLEGAIGAYALLLPLLLAGTEPLFRFVYQNLDPSFYTLSLLRFLVSGLILLVPTTLMGATLPVLSKYFVDRSGRLGRNVGLVYGVNTCGAVVGSLAAGFLLIPSLGITWTILLAALLNLSIGGGAWLVAGKSARWEPSTGTEKVTGKKPKRKRVEPNLPATSSSVIWVVMAGVGLSGLAAMMYQIAWTRVLSLSIGSSVYSFSLIVTAFIGGLALGSLLIATIIDKPRNLVLGLALIEGGIGIAALLIIPLLGKLPIFLAESVLGSSYSFHYLQLVEFAIIFGLILIPTSLMGAALPLAVKICSTDVKQVGRSFGNVYAVNTLGAITGSVVAGFLLIPWLGTQDSLLVAVAINILAAGLILLRVPNLTLPRRVGGSLVMAVLPLLVWNPVSQWDANILTSGAYLYAETYRDTSAQQNIGLEEAMKKGRELLFFREGLHAVVSVQKTSDGDLVLNVNGKTDATARGDAATQLMLGHLPLLLNPDADDVLVIGLGSGMTLGAVERYPVSRVDVVEIEEAVVEAHAFFQDFTGAVLEDPRVNLIVADGRNHLALTDRSYDVIISEPSNPWISGMANLFTQEFFEQASAHLLPEGVMCQWVHAYSMSSEDFKTIIHTFRSVFPNTSVWEASLGGDYLLVGSRQEIPMNHQVLVDRLRDEGSRADLETLNLRDLATFADKLVIAGKAVNRYTKGAPLHTDDNARLEYSAPIALLQDRSTVLLQELYSHALTPVEAMKSLGWIEIAARIEDDSSRLFQAKQEVLAGYAHFTEGEAQGATARFEEALRVSPRDYNASYLLAKLNYGLGKSLKNAERLEEANQAYQKSVKTIENFTSDDPALLSGHFDLEVTYVMAQLDLGIMALKADRLTEATRAFERSVSGEVHYAIAHNNLGIVYDRSGQYDAALTQYRWAT